MPLFTGSPAACTCTHVQYHMLRLNMVTWGANISAHIALLHECKAVCDCPSKVPCQLWIHNRLPMLFVQLHVQLHVQRYTQLYVQLYVR